MAPNGNLEEDEEIAVPIAIQTYFWGLTGPFVRPKLGKLHEATCVVRKSLNIFFTHFKSSNF